MRVEDRREQEK